MSTKGILIEINDELKRMIEKAKDQIPNDVNEQLKS